jgi:hypothetical protein
MTDGAAGLVACRLLKPGAYFVITSQCHDEDELLRFFTREPVRAPASTTTTKDLLLWPLIMHATLVRRKASPRAVISSWSRTSPTRSPTCG